MAFTPSAFAKRLRAVGKSFDRERSNALRRVLRRARTAAIKRIRSRGIGRALWGGKAKGATLLVKVDRVKRTGTSLTSGMTAKGVAALIAVGGRTKAHTIKPKLGNVLAMSLPGGMAFARSVRHPGSRVPQDAFMHAAAEQVKAGLPAELEIANRRVIAAELG